jgi:uncharacterized protein
MAQIQARENWEFEADEEISLDEFSRVPDETAERRERLELARIERRTGLASRLAMRMAPVYQRLHDVQTRLQPVRAVQHRLALHGFPRGAPELRVAFVSDLHLGPTTGSVAVQQAWEILRAAQPDVLLIGGDLLFGDERGLPSLLRELQSWKRNPPPGGMFAVLGNHDHLAGVDTIITALEACGVRVLVNNARPLPAPWKGIYIVGSDDTLYGDAQPELALASVPSDALAIMLAHSPDICEYSILGRCALTLCGHTHGGQVSLPGVGPVLMRSSWGRRFPADLHRHNGTHLWVSRGVGTVHFPLRLCAPPDVGVFDLHA